MRRTILVAVACGALALSACAGGGSPDSEASAADIEDTVRRSVDAENAKDVDTFLALWTDEGLESFDVGSREDLQAGRTEQMGEEKIQILRFSGTTITGPDAETMVDVVRGETQIAKPLFRAKFTLIRRSGNWLLNRFEFLGSPPPAEGVAVVSVQAREYAFDLDRTNAPGDVAFRLVNTGQEQHELTLIKAPGGVDLPTARAAVENLDGRELAGAPAGYGADNVGFVEVGQSTDVTFAQPLAPGTYLLACYIPQGGFGDDGPVNPDGKPHIQLGMVSMLTVS